MSSNDSEKARSVLEELGYSLVVTKGFMSLTSYGKGISPIIELMENDFDLTGFSAADKIVGKAAALLFVKAKVTYVFGKVMSKGAVKVFKEHGIDYSYNELTDAIINRKKTGLCPMEEAVKDVSSPDEALEAIKNALESIKNDKK